MTEKGLVVRPETGLALADDPNAVVDVAINAAKALQRVVDNMPRKIMIAGKQYLQFEAWQTVGQFYGYSVRSHDPHYVEVNGVSGASAKAELIDFRTGLVVGGAEAYCLSDEENWAGKPWFQLASMAQTRAASKALRNRLAWVAVLAGYEPTPAEEMTGNEQHGEQKPKHFCDKHNIAFRRHEKEGKVWYSHKDGDSWCNESSARETVQEPPKPTRPVARGDDVGDRIIAERAAEQAHIDASWARPEPPKTSPPVARGDDIHNDTAAMQAIADGPTQRRSGTDALCHKCGEIIRDWLAPDGKGKVSADRMIEQSVKVLFAPHCHDCYKTVKTRRDEISAEWLIRWNEAQEAGVHLDLVLPAKPQAAESGKRQESLLDAQERALAQLKAIVEGLPEPVKQEAIA